MPALISSYNSGFLLHSKDMKLGLMGDSKMPIGVNACLYLQASPVIDWQPAQLYTASCRLVSIPLQPLIGIDSGHRDTFILNSHPDIP